MKLFVIISCAALVGIIGLRSEYQGQDLYNSLGTGYFFYYDYINEDSWIEILHNFGKQKYANFEIGFVLFCKFLGVIYDNHQILLWGCAAISIVPAFCFIYKRSKNMWVSMVLYLALPMFATAHFSAIRQGIAIGLVMFSWIFIREKRIVPFVLTIIVACTFHSTAIVALVAYPAYHFRLDKTSGLFGGVGVLAIIYVMKDLLFAILARLVASDPEIFKSNAINFFLLLSGLYFLCVAICKKEDVETRGFLNVFWLACATQAFAGVNNLAGRVAWYFLPTLVIIIPNLLTDGNIKEKYILSVMSWMVGFGAVGLGLYYLASNEMAMACPYIPFWDTINLNK